MLYVVVDVVLQHVPIWYMLIVLCMCNIYAHEYMNTYIHIMCMHIHFYTHIIYIYIYICVCWDQLCLLSTLSYAQSVI